MSNLRKKWECEKRSGVEVWGGGGAGEGGEYVQHSCHFSFVLYRGYRLRDIPFHSPGKIQKNSTFASRPEYDFYFFIFLLLIVGDYNPPPTERLS